MRNLTEVQSALRDKVGGEDALKLVHTRVFLRTGVNLKQVRPEQDADAGTVGKVLGALAALGYALS